ncbi:MAG: hybrid sensor histidine kinase/response regulator [Nitrospirota bacterium]
MSRQHKDSVILVVDDDPFVLHSASLVLGAYGYQVIAAENAREALDRFRSNPVDAVLTDVKMPGVSGIELLEQLRLLDPDIPVILMTAYADLEVAIDAVKKGAFDFITKPYKPDHLLHALEKAVRYRKLIQVEQDYRRILEEFNKEMETLIAERTMSLMALALADRVRNPAATISGTGKRLLAKEKLPERVREGLSDMVAEAERLDGIVGEFQEILKSRRSLFSYEDLNSITGSVAAIVVREAADRGIEMSVDLSTQPLRINAEKNLLRVAIFHILRNALEATPAGGSVSVSTRAEGEDVVLTIADTGSGIPPEEVSRIFDPFYSTKEHQFGMGLPLAKQIIEEHLGAIDVESEPGRGTAFRLRFPARWFEKVPFSEKAR